MRSEHYFARDCVFQTAHDLIHVGALPVYRTPFKSCWGQVEPLVSRDDCNTYSRDAGWRAPVSIFGAGGELLGNVVEIGLRGSREVGAHA